MPDADLRIRVERLLKGTASPQDIAELFIQLRLRAFGRQSIIETGHFIAHRDERNKGVVTDRSKDLFLFMRFRFPFMGQRIPMDFAKMPAITPAALEANLRIMSDELILSRSGMKRKAAEHALQAMAAKFRKNPDGTLNFGKLPDGDDEKIFDAVANMLTPGSASFTDDTLVSDLVHVLKKNKLLADSEEGQLLRYRAPVSLFPIPIMHGSVVDLGDGMQGKLRADRYYQGDVLWVSVELEVPAISRSAGASRVAVAMYTTSLHARDHCSVDLLSEPEWNFPLELRGDWKLARLS